MENKNSKALLRKKVLAELANVPAEKRLSDSEKLCAILEGEPFLRDAATILFFAPLPDEPDVWPTLTGALARGKIVTLPCFDATANRYAPRRVTRLQEELVLGRFGIREPAVGCFEMPLNELDVALVPGVAFDQRGYRLGRGRGFYDRMLAEFAGDKVGIALDEQVVDAVPMERQDVRMDFILTPTRCVRCHRW